MQLLCCNSRFGNRLGKVALIVQERQTHMFRIFFFFLMWNLHRVDYFSRVRRGKRQLHTWNVGTSTPPRCQPCNTLCQGTQAYPYFFHCSYDFPTWWHVLLWAPVPVVPCCPIWPGLWLLWSTHLQFPWGKLGPKKNKFKYLNKRLWLKSAQSNRGMFSHLLTRK